MQPTSIGAKIDNNYMGIHYFILFPVDYGLISLVYPDDFLCRFLVEDHWDSEMEYLRQDCWRLLWPSMDFVRALSSQTGRSEDHRSQQHDQQSETSTDCGLFLHPRSFAAMPFDVHSQFRTYEASSAAPVRSLAARYPPHIKSYARLLARSSNVSCGVGTSSVEQSAELHLVEYTAAECKEEEEEEDQLLPPLTQRALAMLGGSRGSDDTPSHVYSAAGENGNGSTCTSSTEYDGSAGGEGDSVADTVYDCCDSFPSPMTQQQTVFEDAGPHVVAGGQLRIKTENGMECSASDDNATSQLGKDCTPADQCTCHDVAWCLLTSACLSRGDGRPFYCVSVTMTLCAAAV